MVLQAMESTNSNKPVVKVPVGISARHIHLTQEDVEKLFGKGYQLTKKKDLMFARISLYEAKFDFKTAYRYAKEYVKAYPDDEKGKKEATFLETR